MSKKTKRGGKRSGAGRPRLPESERPTQVIVRLYPPELAKLLRHGPNASRAILAILAEKGIVADREKACIIRRLA